MLPDGFLDFMFLKLGNFEIGANLVPIQSVRAAGIDGYSGGLLPQLVRDVTSHCVDACRGEVGLHPGFFTFL